jgi:hypothetical protein
MRSIVRFSAGAAGTLLFCVGCGPCEPSGPDLPGAAAQGGDVANGLHLNGLHLNGLHLNGIHLNGLHLNGIQLNGLSIGGIHLNNVALSGGALTATGPSGKTVTGADLAGATFAATLSDGTPLTLRIDGATPAVPDGQLYTVSWLGPGASGFTPLCTDDSGAPVGAVALSGTWDESEGTPTGGAHVENPNVFTFACSGYALAKCVAIGYAPWRTVTECRAPGDCHTLPLGPYHQACTRLLRADYCGDGTATTRDGTLVDVYDTVGLQTDDAATWPMEAEWTIAGASCVMRTRWATIEGDDQGVAAYIQEHCPARWHTLGCGSTSSTFFTANGYSTLLGLRVLLRSRIQDASAL